MYMMISIFVHFYKTTPPKPDTEKNQHFPIFLNKEADH